MGRQEKLALVLLAVASVWCGVQYTKAWGKAPLYEKAIDPSDICQPPKLATTGSLPAKKVTAPRVYASLERQIEAETAARKADWLAKKTASAGIYVSLERQIEAEAAAREANWLKMLEDKRQRLPGPMTDMPKGEAAQRQVFATVAKKTGVDMQVLWRMFRLETDCGKALGDYDFTAMTPEDVTAIKAICWRLELDWQKVPCSKAGAIGLMQFMPNVWLECGQDADGDGTPNPWSLQDAVLSAAKFLVSLKYHDEPEEAVSFYAGGKKTPDRDEKVASYVDCVFASFVH